MPLPGTDAPRALPADRGCTWPPCLPAADAEERTRDRVLERRTGTRPRQRRRTRRPARLHPRRRPPPPGPPVPQRRDRGQARCPRRRRCRPPRPPLRPQLPGPVHPGQRLPGHRQPWRSSSSARWPGRRSGPRSSPSSVSRRWNAATRPRSSRPGPDITARAQALSAALSRDGFVASAASIEAKAPLPAALSSVQLCQGHCPIQQLAAQFPVFCDVETEVFSRLVGVDVRRLSTLARGGHVCTTHIPTGRPAAGGPPGPAAAPDSLDEVSNHLQERP